jgi:hypothetical protein
MSRGIALRIELTRRDRQQVDELMSSGLQPERGRTSRVAWGMPPRPILTHYHS